MKSILSAILFLTLSTSALAQADSSKHVLRVSTESEQGVLVEVPDAEQQRIGTRRSILNVSLLELRLPVGSKLSLRGLEEGSIRGRHDEETQTTTFTGDYSVEITKGEQTVAHVTAREAKFEVLRKDSSGSKGQ